MKKMAGRQPVDQAKLRGNLEKLPPNIVQVLKNFVSPNQNNRPVETEDERNRIDVPRLKKLSDAIANNINAATDLRQITPYISKAELIWTTLLLYPNGLQKEILTYDTNNSDIKNVKLHDELIKVMKEYYTNTYKIEATLPKRVKDPLLGTGSYITLNISRPALDHLINGSQLVEGNEELRSEYLTNKIGEYFVKDDEGKYRAKNFGLVRGHNVPKVVQGIEGLFNNTPVDNGSEFNLFEDKDFAKITGITVTDNPVILSINTLNKLRSQSALEQVAGSEDYRGLIDQIIDAKYKKTPSDNGKDPKKKKKDTVPQANTKTEIMSMAQLEALQSSLYPNRHYQPEKFQRIREEASYSTPVFGVPLTFKGVPSEAVILIHDNGNVKKHLGAYILLDENGDFIRMTTDAEYYQSPRKVKDKVNNNNESGSMNSLIDSLKKVQEGTSTDFDMSAFAKLTKDLMEREFIAAIASGRGDSVSVELTEDILKLMLARMFHHQRTRCLYVPAECLSYFAFQYDERMGVGQSLTNQAKHFIARLAAMDIADALANLEMAQPHNLMEMTLEKEDDDPFNTQAQARAQWFATNPTIHDMISGGYMSIPDITDALKEQTLTIKVNPGDNPHVPTPDITISQQEKNGFKVVDDASRQNLLNNIANTFGLEKVWLDVTDSNNNFNIEALAEQEMLRNRTIMYQSLIAEGIIDEIKKHTILNRPLMEKLIKTIMENEKNLKPDSKIELEVKDMGSKVNLILNDFLSNLVVTLPPPATTETTNKLKDKIGAIKDLVEQWLEMSGGKVLIEEMLKAAGIEAESFNAETIVARLKSVYMIKAYQIFNIPMPFDEILNQGHEGGMYSLIDHVDQYDKNMSKFLSLFGKQVNKNQEDFIKDLQKNKVIPKEESEELPEEPGEGDTSEEPLDNEEGAEDNPDDLNPPNPDDVDTDLPPEGSEDNSEEDYEEDNQNENDNEENNEEIEE